MKVTVLDPCDAPKFVPLIITYVPTAPEGGVRLVMLGTAVSESIVKFTPLLATPDTVTTTGPVVAPFGTVTVMLVAPQLVTGAVVPLNVTVPLPWLAPKFVPVIVTDVPTAPDVGDRLVMFGAVDETAVIVVEPQSDPVHAVTVTEPVPTAKAWP